MRLQPQGCGAAVDELSLVLGLVWYRVGKLSPTGEKKKKFVGVFG